MNFMTVTDWATVALGVIGLAVLLTIRFHERSAAKWRGEEDRCEGCGEEMFPFEEHCCYGRR